MTVTTYYRPGLVFKAKPGALAHQECCFKGTEETRNSDGTLREEGYRQLWAEFGILGQEFTYTDPDTDHVERGADIRGGYFNLDIQAQEKNWDDREKELVARHMIKMLDVGWVQFSLYTETPATAPWPTYDSTAWGAVPGLAEQLGLVSESLTYERQNKKRDSVIAKLEELLAVPEEVDEELLAAT